jgi:hypothetical protein
MSHGFFARLIARWRRPEPAPHDAASRPIDDHDQKLLFAEILAASVVLDFGGVPSDFFQRRVAPAPSGTAPGAKRT